jgi:hypothetical protein
MKISKQDYINLLQSLTTAWTYHANFAIELVKIIKPEIIVDLGVDYGYSTFSFAYPVIGEVYGVDWFQGDIHASFRNTYDSVLDFKEKIKNEYEIDNIKIIKSDFNDFSNEWNKKIDILHIDGEHSYESVSSNYNTFSKFLTNESVVLFHDTLSFIDTVGLFFNQLDGYKINRHQSHGLGILTKSKETYDKIMTIKDIC